ncbi:MAG: hypothetical protein IPJ13_27045 [Saprospiraceae bacterium]|nr:hypothetical protein [Saprospiraceae bacterium]
MPTIPSLLPKINSSRQGSGRYLLRGTKMTMFNYYENRRSTQDIYSYDAWSNPTDVYSRTYINSPQQVIESQRVVSTYGAYGSSIPDKPISISSTVAGQVLPTIHPMPLYLTIAWDRWRKRKNFWGSQRK